MSRLLDLLTLKERVLAAEVVAEHREQTVAVSTLEADGANGRPPHRAFDDAEGVLDARATGNERRRSCRRRPNPRRSRRRFRPSAERRTERLGHFLCARSGGETEHSAARTGRNDVSENTASSRHVGVPLSGKISFRST